MENKDIEGHTPPMTGGGSGNKRSRAVRLKSADDVKHLLAKTINGLIRDEVSESKSAKIGYLCNIMLHSIEVADFEERLVTLEEHMKNQGSSG